MKESIYIKNFGPIKEIYIAEIKPITVLIGESGSGKSTFMKILALFRWIYKMQNIRSYLKNSSISKTPFRFRMETYMKNCGFEQFITNETEIIYTTKFENEKKYEIKFSKNKLSGTAEVIARDDMFYNKISFISETRNIIPLWADKGASFAGGYLGYYFHEVYKDFDIATENLKEFPINFLDLKFINKKTNSGRKYIVQSKNENYEIDFKNSSSGTQTSIPIAVIAAYFSKKFNFEESFKKTVINYLFNTDSLTDFKPVKNMTDIQKKIYIHIEEPELSLYPDAQCELISDIIDKCFIENSNEIELFFSTHSPYIINYLNLLIKKFDTNQEGSKINFNDLSVYQIEKGELNDLMAKNERVVNTNPLSETINQIYDEYTNLD